MFLLLWQWPRLGAAADALMERLRPAAARARIEALRTAVAAGSEVRGRDALLAHYGAAMGAFTEGAGWAYFDCREGICARAAADGLEVPAQVALASGDDARL